MTYLGILLYPVTVRGHKLYFSIHRKGAKDAKKIVISLNIFFASFAPLR
jgi:hypothetical protein